MNTPLLVADGLVKELKGAEAPVLAISDVNLTINEGEFVAITGPSGSGKSTLLYLLGALDRPTRGTVSLDGVITSHLQDAKLAKLRNLKVGFVFQFHFLLPELSALDNVALPLRVAGWKAGPARARALTLLEAMEIGHRKSHKPHQLSGGQAQRVAIARALAHSPRLLLGDELTGNLDSSNSRLVYDILRRRNLELGQTLVIVTHDLELARLADRCIELVDGRITSDSRA
jgi:lipoprotein-releasing system ATP-binding protein